MAGPLNKKIIVCCDGTWQNGDAGYTKPTLVPYQPYGLLQVPSNVVRISRALLRHDFRGKPQIVYYQAGVGSGSTFFDKITGGLLGLGISENIREAYSFITTNFVPGDEIILIGFSRGAYTARSISGLIKDIGLLTREGMADFFAIFKDVQNSRNTKYNDIFPTTPFPNKPPPGRHMMNEYRRRLEENGMTRVFNPDGSPIEVQAVAVWDTVGSLGIPSIGWLQKIGLPHATHELKFFDTALSNTIRHAFQALALDEHRGPFSPAVWERRSGNKTDLRQVWFPGAHSNVGGGYDDQEIANVTLAWMMDQLASIGVEFQDEIINTLFEENRQFYEHPPKKPVTISSLVTPTPRPWAIPEVYEKHKPVRPWALGKIYESDTGIYRATGRINRTPGQYKRADADTGNPTDIPMTHTNERIHSSVRIRLELEGLGLDDKGLYDCPALLANDSWALRQIRIKVYDPISRNAEWGRPSGANGSATEPESDLRWVWQWSGPKSDAPHNQTMIEENLGPYEKRLLLLNAEQQEHTNEIQQSHYGLGVWAADCIIGREQRQKRRRRRTKSREV